MATHSSILVWRISWTQEPGELQSMGSKRARHDRATNTEKTEGGRRANETHHLSLLTQARRLRAGPHRLPGFALTKPTVPTEAPSGHQSALLRREVAGRTGGDRLTLF